MTEQVGKVGVALIAVAVLAGCGSTSTPAPSPAGNAVDVTSPSPSTPPATTTTPAPAESSEPIPDLATRIKAAGIDCSGQQMVGNVKCSYQGEQVTVSVLSWSGTKDRRQQACDAGYVNPGFVVATDGDHLMISADFNATAQKLAKKLGLDVRTYCPS